MHSWGDAWFEENGQALYKAIKLFQRLNDWFRGPTFFNKEKWGTMRLEYFHLTALLDVWLFRRNVIFIRSKMLRKISILLYPVFRILLINKLICAYQRLVFNLSTLYVVRKYPTVKVEVIDEFEFDELLYQWVKKALNREDNWEVFK